MRGLWDLCACQAEFGEIVQRLVRQMILSVVLIKKVYKLELTQLPHEKRDIGLPRAAVTREIFSNA